MTSPDFLYTYDSLIERMHSTHSNPKALGLWSYLHHMYSVQGAGDGTLSYQQFLTVAQDVFHFNSKEIQQMLEAFDSIYWSRHDDRIYLKSLRHVMIFFDCFPSDSLAAKICHRVVSIPLSTVTGDRSKALLPATTMEWRAVLYGAWVTRPVDGARGVDPLPRQTIQSRTGLHPTTQRKYERACKRRGFKIKKQYNFSLILRLSEAEYRQSCRRVFSEPVLHRILTRTGGMFLGDQGRYRFMRPEGGYAGLYEQLGNTYICDKPMDTPRTLLNYSFDDQAPCTPQGLELKFANPDLSGLSDKVRDAFHHVLPKERAYITSEKPVIARTLRKHTPVNCLGQQDQLSHSYNRQGVRVGIYKKLDRSIPKGVEFPLDDQSLPWEEEKRAIQNRSVFLSLSEHPTTQVEKETVMQDSVTEAEQISPECQDVSTTYVPEAVDCTAFREFMAEATPVEPISIEEFLNAGPSPVTSSPSSEESIPQEQSLVMEEIPSTSFLDIEDADTSSADLQENFSLANSPSMDDVSDPVGVDLQKEPTDAKDKSEVGSTYEREHWEEQGYSPKEVDEILELDPNVRKLLRYRDPNKVVGESSQEKKEHSDAFLRFTKGRSLV